jgi:hypothetical protein
MKMRNFLLWIGAMGFMACGEVDKSGAALLNSPEYNMLAAQDNVPAIWSMDLLEMLDESSVRDLDFGMAGIVAKNVLNKITDKDEAGINLSGTSYMVARHDENFHFDYTFTYYPVTNRAKVYSTIKTSIGMFVPGVHNSAEKYDTYETDIGTIGIWDDNHLVVVFGGEDRPVDALHQIAVDVLESRYVDAPDNERIKAFMSLTDDAGCLIDLEKCARMSQVESQLSSDEALIEAYGDGFVVGHANFNEGEMLFSVDVDAENLKQSEFNIFDDSGVSKDLLEFVTTDNSINVGGANLKVNNLVKLVKEVQYDGESLFEVLKEAGITDEILSEALSGEVAFSMFDIRIPPVEEEEEDDFFADDFFEDESYADFLFDVNVQPELIIGLRLGNVDLFEGMMNNIPGTVKTDGILMFKDIYMVEKNGKAVITTSKDIAQRIVKGESLSSQPLAISSDHVKMPLYSYFNTNYDSYSANVKGFLSQYLSSNDLAKLWMAEEINVSGNFDHFELRVIMKNKSENAMSVLVNAFYSALLSGI